MIRLIPEKYKNRLTLATIDHDLEKKYFSRDVRTKMSHVLIADATDQLADLIINCGHKASENN